MKSVTKFVGTTIVGGVLFLVPVIIVVVIVGKAIQIMKRVAEPLSTIAPIESVGDVAFVNLVGVLLVVVVCFVAGLVARSALASRMVSSVESRVLTNIPVYDLLKTKIQATLQVSQDGGLTVVLARFDDQSQIAVEVERLPDGRAVLFLPGSPDPWSGTVAILSNDRVEPLKTAMPPVFRSLKALGKGYSRLLGDSECDPATTSAGLSRPEPV